MLWRALVPLHQRWGALPGVRCHRWMSTSAGSALEWLSQFVNYERKGVPTHAGMDSKEGFDLGRMRRLLARLGNPQRRWAAVHVAGTKGKGSTAALIASILKEADYEVGAYTSPHVAAFNERISVNGRPIATAALNDLVARHRPVVEQVQEEEGGALTYFEIVTALAYTHFAEEELDMAVIEVGLGGVRDATNVLDDSTRVAVLTAMGLDHQDALGAGIEAVATAKAGILREGRPVVIAKQAYPEAEAVIRERAAQLGCPVISAPEEVHFDLWGPEFVGGTGFRDGSEMVLEGPTVAALLDDFSPNNCDVTMRLIGQHQGDNAATAICAAAVLKRQGFHRITLQAVVDGMANAALPGRFQICMFASEPPPSAAPGTSAYLGRAAAVGAGADSSRPRSPSGSGGDVGGAPLTGDPLLDEALSERGVCGDPGPHNPWVVLDGAHTGESAAAVSATLREVFSREPLAIVVAMAEDKQHLEFMKQLRATLPRVVVFTSVPIAGGMKRAAAPGALAAAWQAAGMAPDAPRPPPGHRTRELIQASLGAAVEKARMELAAEAGGRPGVILVCGSMHAVGAALRQLDLVQC